MDMELKLLDTHKVTFRKRKAALEFQVTNEKKKDGLRHSLLYNSLAKINMCYSTTCTVRTSNKNTFIIIMRVYVALI